MVVSLPYYEPGIEDILISSTFLLALNVVNSILDKTLYCGLIGQVLVGVAWGTPGGKWLSSSLEDAIVKLGYLGLIMIVFEGGLSTSVAVMKADLLLSVSVALTGIAAPMALSFFLGPLVRASYIQFFASGAAFCSTSLGTTFTVLSTSGLASTRLGSVLSTAAMMDDVVGLVMVQIVAKLGSGSGSITAPVVIRPVLVSVAFALVLPLVCRFLLRPLKNYVDLQSDTESNTNVFRLLDTMQAAFVIQTATLLALVVGASYAGASVLLAAYISGILVSWWKSDQLTSDQQDSSTDGQSTRVDASGNTAAENIELDVVRSTGSTPTDSSESPSRQMNTREDAPDMYHKYYSQEVERVLKPFFFASIGLSIPISKMFSGKVVWRGIVYSVLMMLGKFICGLWLVRFPVSIGGIKKTVWKLHLFHVGHVHQSY